MPDREREFDIVLFGATGFTGALTAEYLARNAPAGLRWALAGRRPAKLEKVRADLADIDPELKQLELLHADVTDPASLADVAGRARVVITTVGPYLTFGEPLVAACAEAGTDYVDLTGEPEFVDRMYVAHHATAERTAPGSCTRAASTRCRTTWGPTSPSSSSPADQPITLRGVVRASGDVLRRHVPLRDDGALASPADEGGGRGAAPCRAAARGPLLPGGQRRSRAATTCSATGCCPCPRSTPSWWPGAARPWRRTARTSATPTSPAPRPAGSPQVAPPPSPPSARWPR